MMSTKTKHWPLQVTGVAENGAHVESLVGGHVFHTDEPGSRGGTDIVPRRLAPLSPVWLVARRRP